MHLYSQGLLISIKRKKIPQAQGIGPSIMLLSSSIVLEYPSLHPQKFYCGAMHKVKS